MLGGVVLSVVFAASAASWRTEGTPDEVVARRLSEMALLTHARYMPCAIVFLQEGSAWPLDLVSPSATLLLFAVPEVCAQPRLRTLLLSLFAYNCPGYIVQARDPRCFLELWESVRKVSRLRHSPRMLFLPYRSGSYAEGLFSTVEASHHTDLLALEVALPEERSAAKEAVFNLITNDFHKGFGGVFLGSWPTRESLYPDKVSDLRGKVLRYATLQYPPYSMLEPFEGMEVRLAKEFCRKYNCTLVPVTDDFFWGQIFENGTGNGVVGQVYMDKAELGGGALFAWERGQRYLTFSTTYLSSKVTCLVPRPAEVPAWTIPLLPFSSSMWTVQIVSILVSAGILHAVSCLEHLYTGGRGASKRELTSVSGNLLRSWGTALLQPPPSGLITGSTLRLFFTLFETLFLFFTTMYSSALSSYLTVPKFHRPIDSPEELWASGLRWAGGHQSWIYSLEGATDPHTRDLVDRFQRLDTEELIALSKTGGHAFALEILASGHVTEQRHMTGEMMLNYHVMKKPLYTEPSVTAMRKGSPYKEKMDLLVDSTVDTGLLLLWEGEITLKYLSSRLQTASLIAQGKVRGGKYQGGPTSLRVSHIHGALVLLSLGLLTSTALLLGERYYHARSLKA